MALIPRSVEAAMPVYEYLCKDCHKTFEEVLTLTEHNADTVKCPHCGSENVEQEPASFFAVTEKKS
ncbi:MAG TPA: zinc ribbon domain-containing protein [Terriglobales bacterium]|nr:zinc ribbon domain-containing protein [Terriglobales bacterium]